MVPDSERNAAGKSRGKKADEWPAYRADCDNDNDRRFRRPKAWARIKAELSGFPHYAGELARLMELESQGIGNVRFLLAAAMHHFVSSMSREEQREALQTLFKWSDGYGKSGSRRSGRQRRGITAEHEDTRVINGKRFRIVESDDAVSTGKDGTVDLVDRILWLRPGLPPAFREQGIAVMVEHVRRWHR